MKNRQFAYKEKIDFLINDIYWQCKKKKKKK